MTEETISMDGDESLLNNELNVLEGKNSGHPSGLYVLFFTEMWERFSYYGMRAILALYMVNALLFDKVFASNIYGSYTGLVYLTPILGGVISDRYWGNRRSILIGGIVMAIGQFTLFMSAFMKADPAISHPVFFLGLGLLIFGNGFFKPNISTMVGSLYPPKDKRIDSAFTIFYMGINLGAFFSPLICGTLAEKIDYKWGFLAACIGMIIGTLTFVIFKNKHIVTYDGKPVGLPPVKKVLAANEIKPKPSYSSGTLAMMGVLFIALLGGFTYLGGTDFNSVIGTLIYSVNIVVVILVLIDTSLTRIEKERIGVVVILAFFVIFFWSAFEQAGASLTFFADEQTNRTIFGWEMPASYFQSINPVAIVIFAPIFAIMWSKLQKRKMEPSSPLKMSIGLFMLSLGYLVIAFGVHGVQPGVKVTMLFLVAMYLLHTFGELSLSPIGLAIVNKLSPIKLASLMMGVWFMSNAVSNKFAGVLSALYPDPANPVHPHFLGYEITGLYDFFMIFVIMSAASSLLLFIIHRRLLKMMHGVV